MRPSPSPVLAHALYAEFSTGRGTYASCMRCSVLLKIRASRAMPGTAIPAYTPCFAIFGRDLACGGSDLAYRGTGLPCFSTGLACIAVLT